ncbi:biotin transporter BioY [SAR202 cluster bacterium AD-804-J14_MRT_500m]|nr:biotin transporter BioY [SAR202 cluster bacterium AD-804-J14_MRT_500m]
MNIKEESVVVQTQFRTLAEETFASKSIHSHLLLLLTASVLISVLEAISPYKFELIDPLSWGSVVTDAFKDLGIVLGFAIGLAYLGQKGSVLINNNQASVSQSRSVTLIEIISEAARLAIFALFITVFARISIYFGSNPVPITGQTLAILVTAAALGARQGTSATIMYVAMGATGMHVFAGGGFGLFWQVASGGYLIGFIVAAAVIGFLVERGLDKSPGLLLAMLIGNIVIYVPGLLHLAFWVGWDKTMEFGLYPFIPGDLAKLYIASLMMPAAWALVKLRNSSRIPLWK